LYKVSKNNENFHLKFFCDPGLLKNNTFIYQLLIKFKFVKILSLVLKIFFQTQLRTPIFFINSNNIVALDKVLLFSAFVKVIKTL